MKRWIYLFCMNLLLTVNAFAADPNLQKIKRVTTQIQGVQKTLQQEQKKRHELLLSLKQSEVQIGQLTKNMAELDQQIASKRKSLNELEQQKQIVLTKLQNQNHSLARQIQAAYILSRQQSLKILLNQQDPDQVSLMMGYYRYFNHARVALIQQIQTNLTQLAIMLNQIQTETNSLQHDHDQQQAQQQQVQQQQQLRKLVLLQLNKQLQSHQARLTELQANKQVLLEVINHLSQQPLRLNLKALHFANMRGHLAWPVQGKILERFGSVNTEESLKLNGVVIGGSLGQDIHAIYPGQVIFADWLRGFGLLMIIDHGNGYMSLYGRNQSLFRKTGDFVQQGALIAKVGESGGFSKSSLYFAIRHNGNPLDPARWCQ